jgi:hypothetical protein
MRPKWNVHSERAINLIRGKNLVGKATPKDVFILLEHIDGLEAFLDFADEDDRLGTEGWRHAIGLED